MIPLEFDSDEYDSGEDSEDNAINGEDLMDESKANESEGDNSSLNFFSEIQFQKSDYIYSKMFDNMQNDQDNSLKIQEVSDVVHVSTVTSKKRKRAVITRTEDLGSVSAARASLEPKKKMRESAHNNSTLFQKNVKDIILLSIFKRLSILIPNCQVFYSIIYGIFLFNKI